MPFTQNVIANAREMQVFAGIETTPGVQLQPTASAMNLILPSNSPTMNQAVRLIDDPQARNTRSRVQPTTGSFDPGEWSIEALLKAVLQSGAPPEPEIDPLLQAGWGLPATTDATWFGAGSHRAYKLLGVTAGGTVYPSLTLWMKEGHTVSYAVGATVNSMEYNIVGNELAGIVFSGQFMRKGYAGTGQPNSTGSGTVSIVLASLESRKYLLADVNDRLPVQWLRANGTLSTPFLITAINYSTDTLTASTSQSWAADDILVPYLPAGTEVGQSMYGKYSVVRLGDYVSHAFADQPDSRQIITGARVTITNGIVYHADLKDDSKYPTEYVAPNFREVTGEVDLFFYRNVASFMWKAQQCPPHDDYLVLPVRAGCDPAVVEAGSLIELHIPRAVWESPVISGDTEKTATIAFRAQASSAYDDEAGLVYHGTIPSNATTTTTTTTSTTTTTTTTTTTA